MSKASIKSYNRPYSRSRSRGRGWYEKSVYVSSINRKVAPKHRKAALKGSPGRRGSISSAQIHRKMDRRSKRAQLIDRSKQAKRVGDVRSKKDKADWKRDPAGMDLQGIDTRIAKDQYKAKVSKQQLKQKRQEKRKLTKQIIKKKGIEWFEEKFVHRLTTVSIMALLVTLVVLFSLKGEVILKHPQSIGLIAIPLFVQICFIFAIGYVLAKLLGLTYENAAPAAMIGASNHFEVAIATSTMLFGLASGSSLATVVGVLVEVPIMLMLVKICLATRNWFKAVQ